MQKSPSHYQMYFRKGSVALSLRSDDSLFISQQLAKLECLLQPAQDTQETLPSFESETSLVPATRSSALDDPVSRRNMAAYLLRLSRHTQSVYGREKRFLLPPQISPQEDLSVLPSPPAQATSTLKDTGTTQSSGCAIQPVDSDLYRRRTSRKAIGFVCLFIVFYLTLISIKRLITTPVDNIHARQAAYDIAEAYDAWLVHNTPDDSTTAGVLTPYMHYTQIDTSSASSPAPAGQLSLEHCSKTTPCLILYNGSIVQYNIHNRLGHLDAAKTNGWLFNIDPDASGSYNGGLTVVLHANGQLESAESAIQKPLLYAGQAVHLIGQDPPYIHNWQSHPPVKFAGRR